jgi:hypothetical protein
MRRFTISPSCPTLLVLPFWLSRRAAQGSLWRRPKFLGVFTLMGIGLGGITRRKRLIRACPFAVWLYLAQGRVHRLRPPSGHLYARHSHHLRPQKLVEPPLRRPTSYRLLHQKCVARRLSSLDMKSPVCFGGLAYGWPCFHYGDFGSRSPVGSAATLGWPTTRRSAIE